jgi:hypothetical protein
MCKVYLHRFKTQIKKEEVEKKSPERVFFVVIPHTQKAVPPPLGGETAYLSSCFAFGG